MCISSASSPLCCQKQLHLFCDMSSFILVWTTFCVIRFQIWVQTWQWGHACRNHGSSFGHLTESSEGEVQVTWPKITKTALENPFFMCGQNMFFLLIFEIFTDLVNSERKKLLHWVMWRDNCKHPWAFYLALVFRSMFPCRLLENLGWWEKFFLYCFLVRSFDCNSNKIFHMQCVSGTFKVCFIVSTGKYWNHLIPC